MKVRFQTPNIRAKYKSTFHALATIVKEEKLIGLYKGITSPLVSVSKYRITLQRTLSLMNLLKASCALLNGLIFASYGFFMKAQMGLSTATPSLTQVTLAGVATGIVSSFVFCPFIIFLGLSICADPLRLQWNSSRYVSRTH